MAKKREISTEVKEAMKEGLNLQEISWCETYLRTLSIKQACTESGLRKEEASKMLQKESVNRYIMMRSNQHREASERERQEELSREKIAGVLESMILDPLGNSEVKLRAISQLNSMREFDAKNNIVPDDEKKTTVEPVLTAEEAELLLKAMKDKTR